MADYTIRQAEHTDLEAMSGLFRESVQQTCSADYTPTQIAVWLEKASAERWAELFGSDLRFFVAQCGKQTAGFVSINGSGALHSLFIHPAHLRRGVASTLLRTAIRHANEHDASRILTEVSITARPFFEQAGFKILQKQQVSIGAEKLVNYVMELKLAAALQLRSATPNDQPKILEIIRQAQARMRARGSLQWQNGYPDAAHIDSDIHHGYGQVLCDDGAFVAYAAVIVSNEPAYDKIDGTWLTNGPYVVVHRLAVADEALGRGIADGFIRRIETQALQRGIPAFRVDTNFDNAPMLRVLASRGFIRCGEIAYEGAPRIAFEKLLR